MKNNSLLRTPQLFAGARITSIVTMAFGLFVGLKPALAEFEIQEAGIEKGEVELEYRGAFHWGFPNAERGEADEGGALDTEEAEAHCAKVTISRPSGASPIGGSSPSPLVPSSLWGKTSI